MFETEVKIRVRYSETDRMGYVYYGHYATYFEVARVEAIREIGFSYKTLEDEHGILLPVRENWSRFIAPAYYDDLLTVNVSIKRNAIPFVLIFIIKSLEMAMSISIVERLHWFLSINKVENLVNRHKNLAII